MKKIVFGSQGLLLGKIRVRGKSVHPTIKWKGVSAIEKIIKIINGLESLEKEWILTKREPELGPPMISIGRIQGGAEVNSIPEECEIYVSIVYLPMQADEKGRGTLVKKEVEDYVSMLCKGDAWLSQYPAEVTWLNEITPSVIDRNHDLVKNLKKIAEKYLDEPVTVDWGELPSMSRIMNDMVNMPMVLFGPGAIEQAHIIDEWVSVDQYLSYIKIAFEFILDWCGVEL
jgi:acetylornithine deacetylase